MTSLTTAELPQLHQDEGGWWCSDPHGYAWTDRHPTAGAAWDAWVELVASLPVQSWSLVRCDTPSGHGWAPCALEDARPARLPPGELAWWSPYGPSAGLYVARWGRDGSGGAERWPGAAVGASE